MRGLVSTVLGGGRTATGFGVVSVFVSLDERFQFSKLSGDFSSLLGQ